MSEIEHMSSGRKALNFIGCGIGLLLGWAFIVEGSLLGPVIILLVIVFFYRNFLKPFLTSRQASPFADQSFPPPPPPNDEAHPSTAAADQDASAASQRQSNKKTIWSGVGAVALVLAIIVASAVGRWIGGAASSTLQGNDIPSAGEFLENEAIREYVASDFGFKVDFPGFPTREDLSLDLEGYDVPYTSYSRTIRDGDEVYMAVVYDYSAVPIAAADLSLEGALNGVAQIFPEGRLIATSPAELGGLQALEGELSIESEGTPYRAYARAAKRNLNLYLVMTIGAHYERYQPFAASFGFVTP